MLVVISAANESSTRGKGYRVKPLNTKLAKLHVHINLKPTRSQREPGGARGARRSQRGSKSFYNNMFFAASSALPPVLGEVDCTIPSVAITQEPFQAFDHTANTRDSQASMQTSPYHSSGSGEMFFSLFFFSTDDSALFYK